MSQPATKRSAPFRSTKPLPPAGLRPPAPPWAKIAAWAILLLCLGLLLSRGLLLSWADTQPVVALPLPGTPLPHSGPQGLARVAAMSALALRTILRPPGGLVVEGVVALGLSVIALELTLGALLLVI